MMCLYSPHHSLAPPIIPNTLRYFRSLTVVSIKRNGEILKVLRPIKCCTLTYFIKYSHRYTIRIIFSLHHKWSDRADQYSFGYTAFTMFRGIMDNFATAG